MIDINSLTTYRIFEGLTESQVDEFRDVIKERHYSEDEIIFNEGDVGDSIYLLLEGKVEINQALTLRLNKGGYDTREKAIINLSSENKPSFGEISLLGNDDKRTATVKSLTDCKMAVIMRDDFFTICESDAKMGYMVMKNIAAIVSDHLIKANENVLKLTTAFSLVLEK